jgi:fatty-acid peroxygenase
MPANTVASSAQPSVRIPRDGGLDSTLQLLREGYEFIHNRHRSLGSEIFVTRLLGKRVVCLHGKHAAALFYDEQRFQREGALPRRVVTSLFGKRGVQTLDGELHRRRKELFLSLMTPAQLQALADITGRTFEHALHAWATRDQVVLFDEAARLLTRAVCEWAGVPVLSSELPKRARDFERMVDSFGGVGPRLWLGKAARARAEAWIAGVLSDVREGRLQPPVDSAAYVFAKHRGADDEPLPLRVAAVELINVLRPTVAISWYIAFAAHALHANPECRQRLQEPQAFEPDGYAQRFVNEVRRFYPFTPFLGAKARQAFDWQGHHFEPGQLVLLDIYGSLHDPELWPNPDRFDPDRFRERQPTAYDFIPQGGGPALGHRCAGEWLTLQTLTLVVKLLSTRLDYQLVPGQDLSFELSRMPTRPKSGVVLTGVRFLQ